MHRVSHIPVGAPHGVALERFIGVYLRFLPSQVALVILLIVALAVRAETALPRDVSESKIETMPWSKWVKSFGFVETGAYERRRNNARKSASFRKHVAMNMTPLGVVAASSNGRWVTSVQMVGRRSGATREGSLAEIMMFPLGAIKFAIECSSTVKDCSKIVASQCAVQTNFAQGCESQYFADTQA